jgi:ABC-2 type transport system ATP-binding protein
MGIIEVKDVEKKFGNKTILNGVDLSIAEKDTFGIIGVSGSGKTTLLKIMVGLYKPTKGKVFYKGKKLTHTFNKIKREFGFTSQENSVYPKLTVKENLAYFGSLYGLSHRKILERSKEVLQLVQLEESQDVLAQHLSGGMQRRLNLACSIINEPQVLILDEPTEDLDLLLRREIVGVIKKINEMGTTIIITSHILEDIESLCNSVAILHENKVMNVGSVKELRKLYHKEEEVHLETESGK